MSAETHHFHPGLFYFRFEESFHAASRMLVITLDAAALIHTALDPRELGWLPKSAGLAELERASASLLRTLNQNFLGAPWTVGRQHAAARGGG